jgi:hypothetical protein
MVEFSFVSCPRLAGCTLSRSKVRETGTILLGVAGAIACTPPVLPQPAITNGMSVVAAICRCRRFCVCQMALESTYCDHPTLQFLDPLRAM